VTVELADGIDVSRGDMIVHRHNVPHAGRRFEAMVVWMGESPMDIHHPYFIKHTTRMTRLRIDDIRYRVDVNTLNRMDAAPLELNEIGRVVMTATNPLFYDPYNRNRATGSFIIVDASTHNTVGAGMIIDREPPEELPVTLSGGSRAVTGLTYHRSAVEPAERVGRYGQTAATIWLTGLARSGKTAIAYALERRMFDMGGVCVVLAGANVRLGLSRELDFTSEHRAEHLRRVAETARLLNDAGLVVICGFVSPVADVRRQVAEIIGPERFIECHVAAPIEWCETQDESGLYAKARAGETTHVAGVDVPYEAPADPALVLASHEKPVDESVAAVLELLRERKIFPAHG
jgi:bifunctional enzyme CysN/CysC